MEDNLKSIIELKKVILENGNSQSIYYYDRYSKRIFDVNLDGIKIYNKKAKNLKGNILVNIPKESLISIAVDKEINYLLCLLSIQSVDKGMTNNKLIVINAKEKKLYDKIEDDFQYLLGMFFIGKIRQLINYDNNNNQNELYDFCIIHCDKIVFYGIETKNNGEEHCKELIKLEISGTSLIKDFCYDYKHKILCIVKQDLSISFLILTSRKTYKNIIRPKIGYIKALQEKASINGVFRVISGEQKKCVRNNFDNLDKYTETQFYLETIYNSLYFICLCYEDNKIYIHKLENLNSLDKTLYVDFPKHMRFSALQVIDNLIIVHNFLKKEISLIDIKSKIPILRTFSVNFPYQNNLHINGEILEERKVFSKKKLIYVRGGTLYNVIFNGKVYDDLSYFEAKRRRKKRKKTKTKTEEMTRYDILVNLLHRNGSKDSILSILYRIILNNDERPVYIVQFFKEIINLENEAKVKIGSISDKKLVKKELSDSNIIYNVPRPFEVIMLKKNYIKQIDILINLFDKFYIEEKKNNNSINIINDNTNNNNSSINLSDNLILRIMFYMAEFYNQIIVQKMELKPCFHSIFLKYFKILKQKEKIIEFIIHKNIPKSVELAQYLLELSMNENETNRKTYELLGLNMLSKLKKYEIIIDYLLKKGYIDKAMNYLCEVFTKLTYKQIQNLFENNKDIFEQNKDLLLNYLE